jgi:hypothetical protein
MSRTLYQIEQDELALAALMDRLGGDITGVEDEYEALAAELAENRTKKLTGYFKRIKNLEADAAALKAQAATFTDEAARLTALANRHLKQVEDDKRRLKEYMERSGESRLAHPLGEFAVVGVGGKQKVVYLVPADRLPEGLRSEVRSWKADDAAVRAAVGEDGLVRGPNGEVCARLEPKATRLEVR